MLVSHYEVRAMTSMKKEGFMLVGDVWEEGMEVFRLYHRGLDTFEFAFSRRVGEDYFYYADYPIDFNKENTIAICGYDSSNPYAILINSKIDDDLAERILFEEFKLFVVLTR